VTERRTRQLEGVYSIVRAAHDHPSAEEVYQRLRRQQPRVSRGTVYRNLQKLTAQERVRIVHVGDRAARYDAAAGDHDHFACEQCGAVIDLAGARTARPDVFQLGRAGYAVRRYALTFYGTCPDCSGANRQPARRSRKRHRAGSDA
jgi:Fe2+ or Zn2+ uptake regulation protein